jgi:D-alanine-D-alanine ligase
VIEIDVTQNLELLLKSLTPRPDVVFNALHGTGGEDGVIQSLLETLAIPYTHSGVTASAIGMDKVLSRYIFERAGLLTPEWKVVLTNTLEDSPEFAHPFPVPYVIKPLRDGSSKGVQIIRNESDRPLRDETWAHQTEMLIEKFIPGREIQVGVMGDRALGAIEIRPHQGFYDYTAKYTDGQAEHIMPAPLDPAAYKQALDIGLRAHQLLGCRGVSRSDLLYEEKTDNLYLLEINTQPGMTPLSLVPEIAAHEGISFYQLLSWMINNARCDNDSQNKNT